MAKHKLFQQFETNSVIGSSPLKEVSPKENVCCTATNPRSNADVTVASGKEKFDFDNSASVGLSDSDSGSDDTLTASFFKPKPKLPYTMEEDEWILKFVLKGQNIFKVSSVLLWKHLEVKKENPKRTYQSLKNRFLRNIKPQLFTTYGHLIKEEGAAERILAKFPELKYRVGRTKTLSRIKLPSRGPVSKPLKEGTVNQPSEKNGTTPLRKATAAEPHGMPATPSYSTPDDLGWTEANSSSLRLSDLSSVHRKDPVPPSLGMYEKFKNLQMKNELVLCSACGRYNRPRRSGSDLSSGDCEPMTFSGESDVIISNSIEVTRKAHGSRKTRDAATKLRGSSPKRKKLEESEKSVYESSCGSPSLLVNVGEEGEICSVQSEENPGSKEVSEAGGVSDSVVSGKETDSAMQDPLREGDGDEDSAYEDTVTDFRRLITSEEEHLLVKKCIHGNRDALGIDSRLEMNMDSYFVELSPNLDTPTLSNNYSKLSQSSTSKGELGNESSLAKNMMKMLRGDKKVGKFNARN